MSFDFSTLITDRSQADVEALRALLAVPLADWTAEQLAAFNQAASRGAYNYTDLNRVTAAMDDLNERLTALGYETGYQRIVVPHGEMPSSRLPEGYQEVEYIQSSGTQYIDTGVIPTPNTRLGLTFAFLGSAGTNVCGVRNSSSDAINRFGIITFGSSGLFGAFYGGQAINGPNVDAEKHTFSLGPEGFTADNTQYSVQAQAFAISYPLTLMAFSNGAGGVSGAPSRLYSCKIYNGLEKLRDYIPCTNANGVIGLYDLVTTQFYENSGDGDFIAGPDVTPETETTPDPSLDPYTWYEEDIPTATQMVRYLQNVSVLRGALELPENAAGVPADMVGLTLTEANHIETILDTIKDYFDAMQAVFLRSGMAWAVSGGPGFYFVN